MKTENIEKLKNYFGQIYRDSQHEGNSVNDYIKFDDDFDFDIQNFFDQLEENNFFQVDIIYYSHAIEYLKFNDSSLLDSINIALDFGFELQNINSELLASLLASENFRSEFYSYEDEIKSLFLEIEHDELNEFINELKKDHE